MYFIVHCRLWFILNFLQMYPSIFWHYHAVLIPHNVETQESSQQSCWEIQLGVVLQTDLDKHAYKLEQVLHTENRCQSWKALRESKHDRNISFWEEEKKSEHKRYRRCAPALSEWVFLKHYSTGKRKTRVPSEYRWRFLQWEDWRSSSCGLLFKLTGGFLPPSSGCALNCKSGLGSPVLKKHETTD